MFRQIAGRHEEVEDPGLEKVLPNFRALDFRPENINSYIILLILIYFVIFFIFVASFRLFFVNIYYVQWLFFFLFLIVGITILILASLI
jgi:hypothetical protein